MISSTEFLYAGNDVSEEVEHHCEGEAGSPRARTGPSGCGGTTPWCRTFTCKSSPCGARLLLSMLILQLQQDQPGDPEDLRGGAVQGGPGRPAVVSRGLVGAEAL